MAQAQTAYRKEQEGVRAQAERLREITNFIANARSAMVVSNYTLAMTNAQAAVDRDPLNREATSLLAQAQDSFRKAQQARTVAAVPGTTNLFGIPFVWVTKAGAKGAWMARTELSWKDYKTLVNLMGKPRSAVNERAGLTGDGLPAAFESFETAAGFIQSLSEYSRYPTNGCKGVFLLPSTNDYRACVPAELSPDWDRGGLLAVDTVNSLRNEQENVAMTVIGAEPATPTAVSSGKERQGLYNIVGNVPEWTSDPRYVFGVSYFAEKGSSAMTARRLVATPRRGTEHIGLRLMYEE